MDGGAAELGCFHSLEPGVGKSRLPSDPQEDPSVEAYWKGDQVLLYVETHP